LKVHSENMSKSSQSLLAFSPVKNLKRARLKPRKLPAQARSAETVKAVVEAAARILETKGFDGYTTNAVADRAGVSIGSLYQYFPNKDAITKALIQRETSTLLAEVDALDKFDPAQGILRLIRAAVAHQLRRPALARLLDFEETRLPLTKEVRDVRDALSLSLEAMLMNHNAERHTDIATTAQDIVAIVKGMVDAAGERGERDPQVLESRVARAVFGYLQASSPPRSAGLASFPPTL
jgi:AcrR family transcriptional regulator